MSELRLSAGPNHSGPETPEGCAFHTHNVVLVNNTFVLMILFYYSNDIK